MCQEKEIKEVLREIDLECCFLQAAHFFFERVDKKDIPQEMVDIYAEGLLFHTQSLMTKLQKYFIGNMPAFPGVMPEKREKREAKP